MAQTSGGPLHIGTREIRRGEPYVETFMYAGADLTPLATWRCQIRHRATSTTALASADSITATYLPTVKNRPTRTGVAVPDGMTVVVVTFDTATVNALYDTNHRTVVADLERNPDTSSAKTLVSWDGRVVSDVSRAA